MKNFVVKFEILDRLLVWATLAVIALGISSCASRTEIESLYENSAYVGRDYQRVLVVDISGRIDEREQFESLLADSIRAKGRDAIASYTMISANTPLNGQSISDAVNESQSDAVLVTHLANVKIEPSRKEGRVDLEKACRKGAIYDPFLYDYTEIEIPAEAGVSHTATIVANLYDAEDNVRVWAVQSTCFERDSWAEVLADQTNIIAGQLQHARDLRD